MSITLYLIILYRAWFFYALVLHSIFQFLTRSKSSSCGKNRYQILLTYYKSFKKESEKMMLTGPENVSTAKKEGHHNGNSDEFYLCLKFSHMIRKNSSNHVSVILKKSSTSFIWWVFSTCLQMRKYGKNLSELLLCISRSTSHSNPLLPLNDSQK